MIKRAVYPLIEPTREMHEEATIRGDKIPKNIKNSILNGGGIYTGAIGEVVFRHLVSGTESGGREVYHFDVLLPNGKLCEVKSKKRAVPPMSHYECSVANFNAKQECDYYVFTSALDDYSKHWILGYLPKDEFKKVASCRKEGDYDPSNRQTCSADCWNVKINQLYNINDLL